MAHRQGCSHSAGQVMQLLLLHAGPGWGEPSPEMGWVSSGIILAETLKAASAVGKFLGKAGTIESSGSVMAGGRMQCLQRGSTNGEKAGLVILARHHGWTAVGRIAL